MNSDSWQRIKWLVPVLDSHAPSVADHQGGSYIFVFSHAVYPMLYTCKLLHKISWHPQKKVEEPSHRAIYIFRNPCAILGFPDGSDDTESSLQCRRPQFDPWTAKIPWRREGQPTPVFLPGEFHGQRSLAGYSLWDHRQTQLSDWHCVILIYLLDCEHIKRIPCVRASLLVSLTLSFKVSVLWKHQLTCTKKQSHGYSVLFPIGSVNPWKCAFSVLPQTPPATGS